MLKEKSVMSKLENLLIHLVLYQNMVLPQITPTITTKKIRVIILKTILKILKIP